MAWQDIVRTVAPTVATALLGPLGGAAISALGNVLGIDDATQSKISAAIEQGQMTPEIVAKLKELEMQYQENEKERGFKYEELAFKDRNSARQANVVGGIQEKVFWLSLVLLVITIGSEIGVLFFGYPTGTSEMVVGRVLGLMDAVAMMIMAYYYGSSSSSNHKTELLAQSTHSK